MPRPKHSTFFEPLESRTLLTVTLGTLTDTFIFNDSDGDQVTVRLRGPGTCDVTLENNAADLADIDSIALHDTTARTSLTVSVKKTHIGPGDGTTTIGSITGGTIGSVNLAKTTLTGTGVGLTGSLGSFKATGFADGADLIIGSAGGKPLSLDFQTMTGVVDNPVTISTPGTIRSLRVRSDADHTDISVGGGLDKLLLDGAANDFTLSVGGSVRSAQIKGGASNLTANIGGNLKTVTLDGNGIGLNVTVGGAVGDLIVRKSHSQAGSLNDALIGIDKNLKVLKIAGDISGNSIVAATTGIGTVSVGDSMTDTLVLAGTTLDSNLSLVNATFGVASIKSVTIRHDMIDSVIAAGGNPGADRLFSQDEVLPGGRINRVKVGGEIAGINSPNPNPGLYAASLGKVSFGSRVGTAVVDPLPPEI